jgi:hypothetical protein
MIATGFNMPDNEDEVEAGFEQSFLEIFNPNDLSEWINYQPLDFIQVMILEIRQQKVAIDAYSEFLSYAPPDQMISVPGGQISIGRCLRVIKKSAKNIDRLLDTLRAYRNAKDQQNHENSDSR